MDEHVAGGILGALKILKDHWGAVGRDLAWAGYTWDDICGRLPFAQFIQMVVYSPPGTAVFFRVNEGWDPNTHKITDLIDIGKLLLWSKTEAAQDNRDRPEPEVRPGASVPAEEPVMTIGDYMRLSGYFGEED